MTKAEQRAHEVFSGELQQLWLSYEPKKDALLEEFRASREQRLASWQQYLTSNEQTFEQLSCS